MDGVVERRVLWYAVYSNPRCEKRAEQGLRDQGFDVYLPSVTRWRHHARRKEAVKDPLMPRYLFVALDADRPQYFAVRGTDGVAAIVGTLGTPQPVPFAWVNNLRDLETLGQFDETRPADFVDLKTGQAVRVTGGQFSGWIGEIVRAKSDDKRVKVLLRSMGRLAGGEVTIERNKLEAA